MSLKNLQSRLTACLLAVIMSSVSLFAQVTVEHAVVRDGSVESKWGCIVEVGYGILKGYEFTIGPNYNITPNAYVGARIGYNLTDYNSSANEHGVYINSATKIHILRVPVELGYKILDENRNIGIVPFASLGINIGLSGRMKNDSSIEGVKDVDLKAGGQVGIDGILGAKIYFWGFAVSGGFHFPFNDWQKKWFGKEAYPMLSIGWIY